MMLVHEQGNINAVVNKIISDSPDEEPDYMATSTVQQFCTDTDLNLAAKTSLTSTELKGILEKVPENCTSRTTPAATSTQSGKVLSFHCPHCSTIQLPKNQEQVCNPFSMALSDLSSEFSLCPSCCNAVKNSNFCPHCGRMLNKHYRRL